MPPFFLLRLPCLALAEVVKSMELSEVFDLTKTPRKTNNCVKIFSKHIPIELTIHYLSAEIKRVEFHIAGGCWLERETVISNWDGLGNVIDFFATNFQVEKISFNFGNVNPNDALNLLQRACDLAIKFNFVNWQLGFCHESIARNVLKLCSNASSLTFSSHLEKFDFNEFDMLSVNHLSISNSAWVTVDHISSMKNVAHLEVSDLTLSILDLDTILEKWTSCELNFQSMRMVMKNKPREVVNVDAPLGDGLVEVELNDGVHNVQRADGSNGTITIDSKLIRLETQRLRI